MTRFVLLLLITGFSLAGNCQGRIIDSLLQRVHTARNEKEQLTAMLAVCDEYQSLNRDTLDLYAYRTREVASRIGNKREKCLASIAMANDYYRWGWADSAIVAASDALKNAPVEKPEMRDIYFKASRQKALDYGSKSRYAEALEILYQLVINGEKYHDTIAISANLNTIGSIALGRGRGTEGLTLFKRAIGYLNGEERFNAVRAAIFINMAEAFKIMNRQDSAVYYSEKGIELFRKENNLISLALALQRQSNIYIKAGNLNHAESAMKEMIAVRKPLNDGNVWSDDNLMLIDFYIAANQVDKAIQFCYRQLVTGDVYEATDQGKVFVNDIGQRIFYYEALARCYKLKREDKPYQEMLERLVVAKDSFYTISSEKAMAEVQTRYEVQKKENTIIQQELTIAQKNNQLYLSLAIALAIAIISWLLFRFYRKRQRHKVAEAIATEKVLTVKAVADAEENERKRIAADLHDNLGAYAASIASNLDIFNREDLNGQHKTALQELNNNSQAIVSQLSDTIWALNKENLTLTAISDRVKVYLNRIRKSYGNIDMEVQENIIHDIELSPTQAFHLFRIIQEAVTNAVKHSGTENLKVIINEDTSWQISITDDGDGMGDGANFNNRSGNGLRNMKARAAACGWNIKWQDRLPSGTEIIVSPEMINHKNQ